MKTILIPIDGSEFSKRAMEKGKEIASILDCKIILLNVVTNTFPIFPVESTDYAKNIYDYKYSLNAKTKDLAKVYLEESKASFGEYSDKVETVLLEGNAASKILDFLDSGFHIADRCSVGEACNLDDGTDIDLVIMGSKGMSSSGIQKFLVGSVTTKVLHYAKQPVLVLK